MITAEIYIQIGPHTLVAHVSRGALATLQGDVHAARQWLKQ